MNLFTFSQGNEGARGQNGWRLSWTRKAHFVEPLQKQTIRQDMKDEIYSILAGSLWGQIFQSGCHHKNKQQYASTYLYGRCAEKPPASVTEVCRWRSGWRETSVLEREVTMRLSRRKEKLQCAYPGRPIVCASTFHAVPQMASKASTASKEWSEKLSAWLYLWTVRHNLALLAPAKHTPAGYVDLFLPDCY